MLQHVASTRKVMSEVTSEVMSAPLLGSGRAATPHCLSLCCPL
jgi:hypothetical protein